MAASGSDGGTLGGSHAPREGLAGGTLALPDAIGVLRLASILVRYGLRSTRNAFRARGRGRTTVFAVVLGVCTGLAYTGLFSQAFSVVARTVDLGGQLAVLVLVTSTIAFGSMTARAASNEAVRAGSPMNEFLLARPVSLPVLVAARALADAVTDPVAGLFLLPVLIAATFVWNLGPTAWLMAIAISVLVQVAISSLAYAVQIAVVRYVPGRSRRMAWMGLRLVAALALATLWMLGTWVMRAPAALANGVATVGSIVSFSPATLAGAPLAALARGEPGAALGALLVLAAAVGGTMLIVIAFARRAGMAGWEEAGAVWTEISPAPSPTGRLPTAATKDLRLIVRDRSQLLALIALPVIFIGVQIFGAAGWSWTTANLGRISCLSFSLALYMGTIGPLTHMQAERRAFWILRTVPVPLGRLLAAKARTWAIIIASLAALVFSVLSLSVPDVSLSARVGAGLLVTVGAAGIAFIAVAMASGGADLSDETNTAVGPATVYAYLLVGGLFNLVLVENAATRIGGLALYALAAGAYWQAGVEQAEFCLDAEMVRARRVRAADGATMLIVYAVGGRALSTAGKALGDNARMASLGLQMALLLLVGLAAGLYLWRRPGARVRRAAMPSLLVAALAGGCVGAVMRAMSGTALGLPASALVVLALAVLAEELVFRGVLQRAVQEQLAAGQGAASGSDGDVKWLARLGGAAVSVGAGAIAAWLSLNVSGGRIPIVALAGGQVLAAVVYVLTGRVAATWFARLVVVGIAAFT